MKIISNILIIIATLGVISLFTSDPEPAVRRIVSIIILISASGSLIIEHFIKKNEQILYSKTTSSFHGEEKDREKSIRQQKE